MSVLDLLKIVEAAQELRVSRRTIERRIADGSLAATKVRGVVRIPRSELERFILDGLRRQVRS